MRQFILFLCLNTITFFSQEAFAKEKSSKSHNVKVVNADDSIKVTINDSIYFRSHEGQGTIKVGEDEINFSFSEGSDPKIMRKNKNKNIDEEYTGIEEIKKMFVKNKKDKFLKVDLLMMDLGLNGLLDNTNYSQPAAQQFVRVDPSIRNDKVFDLKNWDSRNFNLWPVMFSMRVVNGERQKVLLSSGLGIQWYNYKFNNSVSFEGGLDPHVYIDNKEFSKNKLGITYGSIPLMLTGQTRLNKRNWLTYGIGVIGGYRIASWTNQKSASLGKVKEKDPFNLNPFQLSLTGEFGVTGVIRFYGTYQLTNIWQYGINQQPFAIGVRFMGI